MRKELNHRLSKLERGNKTSIFRVVFIRGTSRAEQETEFERLRREGRTGPDDLLVFEPPKSGLPMSEVLELPSFALKHMLREIDAESRSRR